MKKPHVATHPFIQPQKRAEVLSYLALLQPLKKAEVFPTHFRRTKRQSFKRN